MHANQIQPSENQGWERKKKLDTEIEWKNEREKGTKSFWVAGGGKLGKCSVQHNSSPIGQTQLPFCLLYPFSFFLFNLLPPCHFTAFVFLIYFNNYYFMILMPLPCWKPSLIPKHCVSYIQWHQWGSASLLPHFCISLLQLSISGNNAAFSPFERLLTAIQQCWHLPL